MHAGSDEQGDTEFANDYEENMNQEEGDEAYDGDNGDNDQKNEDSMKTSLHQSLNKLGKYNLSH